jgi:hypothetical protein
MDPFASIIIIQYIGTYLHHLFCFVLLMKASQKDIKGMLSVELFSKVEKSTKSILVFMEDGHVLALPCQNGVATFLSPDQRKMNFWLRPRDGSMSDAHPFS